jgi:cytochrome oxidase Cu insertion factor (SCO1/SenC/PrrC family)
MLHSPQLDKDQQLGKACPSSRPHAQQQWPRLVLWAILILVLIGVAGLGIWSLMTQQPVASLMMPKSAPPLPVYGVVPEFTLVERSGDPVGLEALRGKVWIASFIFTQCPDECSLMTAEMAQLQVELATASDFRLVSITVDPDRDTPTVLSQYAAQFQADAERWLFLTGDKRVIYPLAKQGFRLGISDPTEGLKGTHRRQPVVNAAAFGHPSSGYQALPGPASPASPLPDWLHHLAPAQAWADHGRSRDIGHSTRFVLVDRQARIRGYYESRDPSALQRLRRHTHSLLRER